MEQISLDEIEKKFSVKWEQVLSSKFQAVDMHGLLMRWVEQQDRPELFIPWPALYRLFGGIRQGELTIVTGDTGSGKTTFSFNLVYHISKQQHKSFVLSLEMGPIAIAKKYFQISTGLSQDKKNIINNATLAAEKALDSNIWVLDHEGFISFEQLKKCILWAAIEQKCQFILIDHFHQAIEENADAAKIERYTAELRKLASVLGVAIYVICHPAKIRTKDGSKERPIEMDEMKGSSGIKQFADNVLSIFYNKPANISWLFLKKIRDDRYGQNQGTKISYALRPNLLFEEVDDGHKES